MKPWHCSKSKSQIWVLALLSFSVLQFSYFLPLPILLSWLWKVMPSVICCSPIPNSKSISLMPSGSLTHMVKVRLATTITWHWTQSICTITYSKPFTTGNTDIQKDEANCLGSANGFSPEPRFPNFQAKRYSQFSLKLIINYLQIKLSSPDLQVFPET